MPTKTKSKKSDLRGHFGCHTTPFSRELPVADRWDTHVYNEPLAELRGVVDHRMSGALIAPSGTGKTVILRTLADDLPDARYRVCYVKLGSMGRRDLCRVLAIVLGVEPTGTYPTLVRRVQERLLSSLSDDARLTVALFDDMHEMRPDVLSVLRTLTNFDMDSRLALSVILCGQPPLRNLLKRAEVESLTQRLACVTLVRLLSRAEACDYISHRLTIAGCKSEPFDHGALDAIYEVTRGNLRAIDHVAFKALQLATQQNVPVIDASLVVEARKRVMV